MIKTFTTHPWLLKIKKESQQIEKIKETGGEIKKIKAIENKEIVEIRQEFEVENIEAKQGGKMQETNQKEELVAKKKSKETEKKEITENPNQTTDLKKEVTEEKEITNTIVNDLRQPKEMVHREERDSEEIQQIEGNGIAERDNDKKTEVKKDKNKTENEGTQDKSEKIKNKTENKETPDKSEKIKNRKKIKHKTENYENFIGLYIPTQARTHSIEIKEIHQEFFIETNDSKITNIFGEHLPYFKKIPKFQKNYKNFLICNFIVFIEESLIKNEELLKALESDLGYIRKSFSVAAQSVLDDKIGPRYQRKKEQRRETFSLFMFFPFGEKGFCSSQLPLFFSFFSVFFLPLSFFLVSFVSIFSSQKRQSNWCSPLSKRLHRNIQFYFRKQI